LWKPQAAHFRFILYVGAVSLFVLGVGMLLEWVSLLATRIKSDLEASYESE
jgi:hypothetical protein